MDDLMTFPKTWEEFEQSYGFTDTDEVYTNGSRLIQSFRVKQWLEHMKTQTVDAVSVVQCKDCRWGREACGNIECFVDSNMPSEYHGYEWFCPNGERKSE